MRHQSDFERVLMNIALDTAGTVHDSMKRLERGWQLRFTFDRPSAQFIPLELADVIGMPLKMGDIVRCVTNPNHHWGISVFIERLEYGKWLLQEIGGTALLKMGNESVEVLRFMEPSRLYTGKQYQVYLWARKAFYKRYNPDANLSLRRCGGVEFDGETLTIWCRPHIFHMDRKDVHGVMTYAKPKKFTLRWSKRTRLKDIVSAMKNQGFGNDFEFVAEKPTEGQEGYSSFTKKDIENVLSNSLRAEGSVERELRLIG